jgi:hypothetical protein
MFMFSEQSTGGTRCAILHSPEKRYSAPPPRLPRPAIGPAVAPGPHAGGDRAFQMIKGTNVLNRLDRVDDASLPGRQTDIPVFLEKFTLQVRAGVASIPRFELDAMMRVKEDGWPDKK